MGVSGCGFGKWPLAAGSLSLKKGWSSQNTTSVGSFLLVTLVTGLEEGQCFCQGHL